MEIRSRFTVKIPDFLLKVLGINEKSKITPTFQDGRLVLDIVSHNRKFLDVGQTATLVLDQEKWMRSGFIAGRRKGRAEGYEDGYDEGHDDGFKAGCELGELEGYFEGYGNGYRDGREGNPYDDIRPGSVEEAECDGDCENCPYRED